MAGVRLVSITVGVEPVEQAMRRLLASVESLEPALQDIGEHLLNATRERWARMVSPTGEKWAKLNEDYKARKKKNKAKILTLDGHLRGLLRYQVMEDELALGTNLIYAAAQHFGYEAIPARPFLGISAEDENAIIQILAAHVSPDHGS